MVSVIKEEEGKSQTHSINKHEKEEYNNVEDMVLACKKTYSLGAKIRYNYGERAKYI